VSSSQLPLASLRFLLFKEHISLLEALCARPAPSSVLAISTLHGCMNPPYHPSINLRVEVVTFALVVLLVGRKKEGQ